MREKGAYVREAFGFPRGDMGRLPWTIEEFVAAKVAFLTSIPVGWRALWLAEASIRLTLGGSRVLALASLRRVELQECTAFDVRRRPVQREAAWRCSFWTRRWGVGWGIMIARAGQRLLLQYSKDGLPDLKRICCTRGRDMISWARVCGKARNHARGRWPDSANLQCRQPSSYRAVVRKY